MASWLRYEGVLGGVVGCSSALCANIDWKYVDVEDKKKTPVLLYHGTDDEMIPIDFAAATYKRLLEYGIDHMDWVAQKGLTHSLSMDEVEKLTEFF